MRKLIAVAAVLTISSVQAAEVLKFGDVNYFIKQGQVNVLADVNSAYAKRTFDGTTLETRGVITNTALGYAFTDRFNAYVGVSYAFDNETNNKDVPADDKFKSDGFSNPSLGLNYRLINQNEGDFNFDIGSVLRVGVEDAKVGSSSGKTVKDGNFATGRDSLEVNARIGKKWNEANEWQAAAGAVYYNDGDYKYRDAVSGSTTKNDQNSSFDYFLKGTYQYRPVNEFMILLSAQANYIGEATGKNKSTNRKSTSDAHIDVDLNFTAKYLITENFITKFNFGQSRNSDYDVKVAGVKTKNEKRREGFLGIGFEFLF